MTWQRFLLFSVLKQGVFKTILKLFSQFFCQRKQAMWNKNKKVTVAVRTAKHHLPSVRLQNNTTVTNHFAFLFYSDTQTTAVQSLNSCFWMTLTKVSSWFKNSGFLRHLSGSWHSYLCMTTFMSIVLTACSYNTGCVTNVTLQMKFVPSNNNRSCCNKRKAASQPVVCHFRLFSPAVRINIFSGLKAYMFSPGLTRSILTLGSVNIIRDNYTSVLAANGHRLKAQG